MDSLADRNILFNDLVSLTEQSKRLLATKLNRDPEFKKAWKTNVSASYYKDLWERLDPDVAVPRNIIQRYYGDPGSSKSWTSLSHVAIEKEFFGVSYEDVFSQMEASIWLVKKQWEAHKNNKIISRVTLNIDEDRKMFGAGSQQEAEYFDSMIEFLRQAQINVHILNPYDISNIDVQFEVIGYDADGFSKSIEYQKIDKRTGAYVPIGYVVTPKPPSNYILAYKQQKDQFIKHFVGNESGRNLKDKTILDIIYNEVMSDSTKVLVGKAIKLNKENDAKHLIFKDMQTFNLPVTYTKILVEDFIWKFFGKEKREAYARQEEALDRKIQKAEKAEVYIHKQGKEKQDSDMLKLMGGK